MDQDMKRVLKGIEIFQDLTPAELVELTSCGSIHIMAAGSRLFEMGQPGDAMYVITQGHVRLYQTFPDGSREVLANLGQGQILGEIAVLDGAPRSAQAVAVSSVQLLRLERAAFNRLRATGRPAAYKVIRRIAGILSKRMRDTNHRLVQFISDPEGSLEYLRKRQGRRA